jgi:hypothetical protein
MGILCSFQASNQGDKADKDQKPVICIWADCGLSFLSMEAARQDCPYFLPILDLKIKQLLRQYPYWTVMR